MAEEEGHPGLEALLDCKDQVQISIRNHIDHVANFLRKQSIIDLKLFTAATDPSSRESLDNRAGMLYQRLQAIVQGDEKYYTIFVEYLRKNSSKFENTISKLDEAYIENGGTLSSATGGSGAVKQQPTSAPASAQVQFSDNFSATVLADWMKKYHNLPDESCKIIKGEGITGSVFRALKEDEMKELGFNFGARKILTKIQAQLSGSVNAPPAVPLGIPSESPGSRTELTESHYSQLCEQLVPAKTAWENIARSLGFLSHEIATIRSNLNRAMSGDQIYDVIEFYLRWAPGDGRGSKDVATLEALQNALNKNNFARIKLTVT